MLSWPEWFVQLWKLRFASLWDELIKTIKWRSVPEQPGRVVKLIKSQPCERKSNCVENIYGIEIERNGQKKILPCKEIISIKEESQLEIDSFVDVRVDRANRIILSKDTFRLTVTYFAASGLGILLATILFWLLL